VHFTIYQKLMIPRLLSGVIISDHPDKKDERAKPVPFFRAFFRSLTLLLFFLKSLSPLASKGEVNHK
jgi:hypothetical protein